MSFNFPPPPSSLPPDPRTGITQNKTEGGKTSFKRQFREGVPGGEKLPFGAGPGNPIDKATLDISGFGTVVANSTNSTINGEGRVSVSFEKGSKNNTFNLSNTTGEKTTAKLDAGADNNTLNFNRDLPPGKSPSPADIHNAGSGNKFTGRVGDHSTVDNQGANASYGSTNEAFKMGPNSSFTGNSNAPNLYFNVDMGPYSTFTVNTSVVNGSVVHLDENSHFYGGPNLSGNFTIDYTGSTAHSGSTTVDLPGYTKNDSRSGPNGDIYEKHDPNTGDTTSEVTVRPPESAGGPHVNTDPGAVSQGYPYDLPLGL